MQAETRAIEAASACASQDRAARAAADAASRESLRKGPRSLRRFALIACATLLGLSVTGASLGYLRQASQSTTVQTSNAVVTQVAPNLRMSLELRQLPGTPQDQ